MIKKNKVVLLFTIEGGLNALLAVFFGSVFFAPLLYYFSIYGIPLPIDYSELGLIVAKRLIPVYSSILILSTTLIVSIIVLIVSYLPSKKISKLHPTDAIRGRAVI